MSQNPIINEILRQGRGKPRSWVLAALETGRIESNFSNPSGGDQDSAGWRQERKRYYSNPTNIRASVKRFYEEAARLDRGQSSYRLAADIQRPREDLRGKYKTAHGEAEQILGGGHSSFTLPTLESTEINVDKTKPYQVFDEKAYQHALNGALLGTVLARRHPNSVLARTGLLTNEIPSRSDFVRKVAGSERVGLATPIPGMPARGGRTRLSGASKSSFSGKVRVFGSNPGRLKPEVLAFAKQVSAIAGIPISANSGATHSKYTTSGNVSQHYTGDATDIPASGKRLIKLGQAALIAAGMSPKKARKQTGGLYNVRGKQIIFNTMEGGDHTTHLHIGD